MGYHTVEITKGELGKSSKIQEELDELKDAENQPAAHSKKENDDFRHY